MHSDVNHENSIEWNLKAQSISEDLFKNENVENLENHLNDCEIKQREILVDCEKCKLAFIDSEDYKTHMKDHKTENNEQNVIDSNLQAQEFAHSFSCGKCELKFKRKSRLFAAFPWLSSTRSVQILSDQEKQCKSVISYK